MNDAPKNDAAPKEKAEPVRKPVVRRDALGKRLTEFLDGIAFMLALSGDPYSAKVIEVQTPALVESWTTLARENKAVARVLDRLLSGGAWGQVVMTSAATLLPIMQHRGWYPNDWPQPFIPADDEGNPIVPPSREVQTAQQKPGTGEPSAEPTVEQRAAQRRAMDDATRKRERQHGDDRPGSSGDRAG